MTNEILKGAFQKYRVTNQKAITTIYYFFDENASLPKLRDENAEAILILESKFLDSIKKKFRLFERVNHKIFRQESNYYLENVEKFKFKKNSDWFSHRPGDLNKDTALLKYFTNGIIDQNEKYRWFFNELPDVEKESYFQSLKQMLPGIDINSIPIDDLCKHLFVMFITKDTNQGMKKAMESLNEEKSKKVSFGVVPIHGGNMGIEQFMDASGSQIGEHLDWVSKEPKFKMGTPPSTYLNISSVELEGDGTMLEIVLEPQQNSHFEMGEIVTVGVILRRAELRIAQPGSISNVSFLNSNKSFKAIIIENLGSDKPDKNKKGEFILLKVKKM